MKSLVVMMDRISLQIWGCYGNFDEWTPNLDSFSVNSFVFDQAFSTDISRENKGDFLCYDWLKPLRKNNIRSYYLGEKQSFSAKWGEQFFDESQIFSGESGTQSNISETSLSRMTVEACSQLDQLSQNNDDSWLVCLGMEGIPHPWFVPEEWLELIGESLELENEEGEALEDDSEPEVQEHLENLFHHYRDQDQPLSREEKELLTQLYSAYGCMVDFHLGKILKKVNEHFTEDVMVILTSAGGDSFIHHPVQISKENSSRLHTGLTESAFQIPLVIQLPVSKEPFREEEQRSCSGRSRELVLTEDLVPTILDWFDVPLVKESKGHSLLPVISEGEASGQDLVLIRGEEGFTALRMSDCIFYWNEKEIPIGKSSEIPHDDLLERLELYVRPEDSHDVNNVASQNPDLVKDFLQIVSGLKI